MHRRCIADADNQPLGAEKTRNRLSPRLGPGAVEERVAPVLELLGSVGDVVDLELDGGLRSGHVGGPRFGAEAGLRRLLQRPKAEVTGALDLSAVEIPGAVVVQLEPKGVD